MADYLTVEEVVTFVAVIILVISAPRVIWIFKYLLNIRRQIKIMAETGISGPPAYPILGNVTQIHQRRYGDIYNRMCKLLADKNPIIRLWFGPVLLCCIKNPEDIELVLNGPTFSERAAQYDILKDFTKGGLFALLPSSTLKRHRKSLSPSFHLNILQDFVEVFYSTGGKLANNLENLADRNEIIDVTPLCGRLANETVCRTVLSTDIENLNLENVDFRSFIERSKEIVLYRLVRPWYLLSEWLFSWTSMYAEAKSYSDFFEHFTTDLIEKKRKDKSNSPNRKFKKRLALLDAILSTDDLALTDEELFGEVKTLMLAGTITSMDALSFVMYTLAIRQDIQEKVYQELRDIFDEDPDRPITHEVLPHMDYLDRVIKETLRIFPIAPFFARNCSEDTKMPSGGTIPKGTTVFLWLPYTHTDPANFPNPTEFDPDRFLPEVARTRHPYSYVPFSAGPKNCIGQRYSMLFLKTTLATILRRVRLVIPEGGPKALSDVAVGATITLLLKDGARLKFERRAISL